MVKINPERKLRYLQTYMNMSIDMWPVKPKPFDRWLESTLDKKVNEGNKNKLNYHKTKCVYCRRPFDESYISKTKDHIVPVSRGGFNKKENRVLSCEDCNSWKSDKLLEVWLTEVKKFIKKEKIRKPYTLTQLGFIVHKLKEMMDYVKDNNKKISTYKCR